MGRKSRIKRDRKEDRLIDLIGNLTEALAIPNGTARGFALMGISQHFPEFSKDQVEAIKATIPHSPPRFWGDKVFLKFEGDKIVKVEG